MCQSQYATGKMSFHEQHEHLRRGDVIGIIGVSWSTDPIYDYADDSSFLVEPVQGRNFKMVFRVLY